MKLIEDDLWTTMSQPKIPMAINYINATYI